MWQPIETAPKDGTAILLYLGKPWGEVRIAAWFVPWRNWHSVETDFPNPLEDEYCGIGSGVPTHWQPLPEAP